MNGCSPSIEIPSKSAEGGNFRHEREKERPSHDGKFSKRDSGGRENERRKKRESVREKERETLEGERRREGEGERRARERRSSPRDGSKNDSLSSLIFSLFPSFYIFYFL